eukprot:Rhum_TRINITY_DN18490_c0_g1::Rhum_TRINITY_DN18490_c0_g1_i1::g.167436::m.167436
MTTPTPHPSGAAFVFACLLATASGVTVAGSGKKVEHGQTSTWTMIPYGAAQLTSVRIHVHTTGWLCNGASVTFTAGCGSFNDACTGFSTTQNFNVGNGKTHTVTLVNDLRVNAKDSSGDWGVFWLSVKNRNSACAATVTPTFLYDFTAPWTSRPVPAPLPTPVFPPPATPRPAAPLPAPTPTPPKQVGPGHMCPSYETPGSNKVHAAACGQAACRTSMYYPLDRQVQGCDPCISGPLPFYVKVTQNGGNSYTLTVTDGAFTQKFTAPCGQCVNSDGFSAMIVCGSSGGGGGGGGGGSSVGVILAAVAGVAVLLGAGVALYFYKRQATTKEVSGVGVPENVGASAREDIALDYRVIQ